MEMKVQTFLSTLQKKTVALHQLEKLFDSSCTYVDFANVIVSFESNGILIPIKSHGTNGKNPPLALGYRIRLQLLQQDHHKEIAQARISLHPSIRLESYFNLPYNRWINDLPYLQLIHSYLERQPLPTAFVPAPERSFEMVSNEKWITELGGQELLERVELWDKLRIMPVSDPLMFAVNPHRVMDKKQCHVIVENKTTYQALLPVLSESDVSTLIYGVGNKIVKNIENFHYQYPTINTEHTFHYFGDIDHEGINIWYKLNKKKAIYPAIPFYCSALIKTPPSGKRNQLRNDEALNQFTAYFSEDMNMQIHKALREGLYYPQEIMTTEELQQIWRDTSWKSMTSQKSTGNVSRGLLFLNHLSN